MEDLICVLATVRTLNNIAYFKIKKRNLVLINNDTYQRETLSERPIRQPLTYLELGLFFVSLKLVEYVSPKFRKGAWSIMHA